MLPEKRNTSLAIARSTTVKAVENRVAMLDIQEVMDSLSTVEKMAFVSSAKRSIRGYEEGELIEKVAKLSDMLAKDLGIRSEIGQYEKTRFFNILRQYYSELTLGEVKIAFDMSLLGELDSYLPKNGHGEPDKGHYQSFSIDYITKILNAYKKRRSEIIIKAHKALPIEPTKVSDQDALEIRRASFRRNKFRYLQYKYRGVFELKGMEEKIIYEAFLRNGIADVIQVSDEEKRKSLSDYLYNSSSGLVNKYTLQEIKKKGIDHQSVVFGGVKYAMRKEVKRVFDYLIKEEIQIDSFLI